MACRLVSSDVMTAMPKELDTRETMFVMEEARPISSVGISTIAAVWAGIIARGIVNPRISVHSMIVVVAVARFR